MKRKETQALVSKRGKQPSEHKTLSQKREEAQARAEVRAERGDKGQLAKLDKEGHTAKRERAKLSKRLSRKAK